MRTSTLPAHRPRGRTVRQPARVTDESGYPAAYRQFRPETARAAVSLLETALPDGIRPGKAPSHGQTVRIQSNLSGWPPY